MRKRTNNLTLKILALLIATFLWVYVMTDENPEDYKIIRNVEVALQNTAELKRNGLVIMNEDDFKVNVRVDGKKSEIGKIKTENIVANVNLTGYGEGQYKIGVGASIQGSSANVRITNIEPRDILINFEKVITKEKPVNIVTDGSVSEGFVLDSVISKPQIILLTGPRSWVNEVAEARVLVNIDGRDKSTSLTLPIQLLDDKGEDVIDVSKDPATVEVALNILHKKTVPIRLQTLGILPDNFRLNELNVAPSSVTIKGDQSINEIEYINTKPIDINSVLNGSTIELELDLPENIQLLDPNEKFILRYNLDEIIEKNFTLAFADLEIRNLDEDLVLEENQRGFTIKLSGFKKNLDELTSNDIKAFVDLRDLGIGLHEAPIGMERIEGLTIESITPETISVTIKAKEE